MFCHYCLKQRGCVVFTTKICCVGASRCLFWLWCRFSRHTGIWLANSWRTMPGVHFECGERSLVAGIAHGGLVGVARSKAYTFDRVRAVRTILASRLCESRGPDSGGRRVLRGPYRNTRPPGGHRGDEIHLRSRSALATLSVLVREASNQWSLAERRLVDRVFHVA
jgi:hypothetical protein